MSVPTELGVAFSSTEIDAMKDAANTIIDTIRGKKAINLSNDERKNLSTVGEDRIPYVTKSILEYADSYPNLNGLAYPLPSAQADLKTYGELFEVLTLLSEATEVAQEMQMVAGHYTYKFMSDQYYNAKRYLGDNVEGAQVVYDGLKGCFEGQGPQAAADNGDDTSAPAPTDQ